MLPHLLMTDCSVPEVDPSCSKTVAAWAGTQRDTVRQGGGHVEPYPKVLFRAVWRTRISMKGAL